MKKTLILSIIFTFSCSTEYEYLVGKYFGVGGMEGFTVVGDPNHPVNSTKNINKNQFLKCP